MKVGDRVLICKKVTEPIGPQTRVTQMFEVASTIVEENCPNEWDEELCFRESAGGLFHMTPDAEGRHRNVGNDEYYLIPHPEFSGAKNEQ